MICDFHTRLTGVKGGESIRDCRKKLQSGGLI
jgi:hypothetical protein